MRTLEFHYIVKITDCSEESQQPCEMESFYSKDGGYIGRWDDFEKLVMKRGINPEKANVRDNVCSIGKSRHDGKWYGWSHRAIYGFSIGDTVKEGDCCAMCGTLEEFRTSENDKSLPVGFVAKTEEDCKRMAIAFADSVS